MDVPLESFQNMAENQQSLNSTPGKTIHLLISAVYIYKKQSNTTYTVIVSRRAYRHIHITLYSLIYLCTVTIENYLFDIFNNKHLRIRLVV